MLTADVVQGRYAISTVMAAVADVNVERVFVGLRLFALFDCLLDDFFFQFADFKIAYCRDIPES